MQNMPSRLTVLTLLCAALVVYFVMLYVTIPTLREFSGGLEVFDLNPRAFEQGEAAILLDALGPEGRSFYLWRQIPLDFLYPGLMGAALSSGIMAIQRWAGWKHRILTILPAFPLIAAGLDYVENVHIIVLLNSYPDLSALVCSSGMVVGIAKSAVYVTGITSFFACLFAGLYVRLKQRSTKA